MNNEVNSLEITHEQIKSYLIEVMLTGKWSRDKKYKRIVFYKGDMLRFEMAVYYMGYISVNDGQREWVGGEIVSVTPKGRRLLNVKRRS